MKLKNFGVVRLSDPEWYDKYFTPDGEARWDVMMANVEPLTPEQEEMRARTIAWNKEKREREEREREQNHNTQSNQPINDKPS